MAEEDLLDSIKGALVAVSDDGIIAHANPAALALLGYDDLVGKPLSTIIPPRLRPRHHEGFRRYLSTGQSRLQGQTVRVPALLADSSETMVDLTIRVYRRPDGSRLAVAAITASPLGKPPLGLRVLEDALAKRLYELI